LVSPVFRCTHFRTHLELKNDHEFSRIDLQIPQYVFLSAQQIDTQLIL